MRGGVGERGSVEKSADVGKSGVWVRKCGGSGRESGDVGMQVREEVWVMRGCICEEVCVVGCV